MVLQSFHSDCQARICALAKNSSFIFLSVGFLRLEKINVLFVRWLFCLNVDGLHDFPHYAQRFSYDFGVDKSAGFVQSRNQLEPSWGFCFKVKKPR